MLAHEACTQTPHRRSAHASAFLTVYARVDVRMHARTHGQTHAHAHVPQVDGGKSHSWDVKTAQWHPDKALIASGAKVPQCNRP